ncbi:MAG: DUF1476 domain-containing protein [Sphingomicrobium sp.]
MGSFDDRERAFETKFAHDEEMKFRITARRNRLLGEWAARQMGLNEAETESYAKDVVRADFEEAGDNDVIRKVLGDLTAADIEVDEDVIVEALRNKEIEARRQIIEASNV